MENEPPSGSCSPAGASGISTVFAASGPVSQPAAGQPTETYTQPKRPCLSSGELSTLRQQLCMASVQSDSKATPNNFSCFPSTAPFATTFFPKQSGVHVFLSSAICDQNAARVSLFPRCPWNAWELGLCCSGPYLNIRCPSSPAHKELRIYYC